MKVEAHNSLKPPSEYNQDQMPSTNQVCLWLFNQFGSLRNMEIQLSFRRKIGKDKPESSWSEFLEKLLGNDCALSNADKNISGLLNRGCISDLILIRTLVSLCHMSQEPSFWEVIKSFVLLA